MTKPPPDADLYPPRWAENLLRALLPPRDRETVTGDLLEEYREIAVPAWGHARANVWYFTQVVSFMKNSNVVIAAAWLAAGAVVLSALSLLMVRTDFGPPPPSILPLPGVMVIALVLGIVGATATRSATDLGFLWRASRFWGITLGITLVVGNTIAILAPRFLMEQGELPHPDHILGVAPIARRLFVVAIAVIFMMAGFRGAWRTSQVRKGIVAAVATSVVGAVLACAVGLVVEMLAFGTIGLRQIPIWAIVVAPMLSTVPGTIGAMLGKGFEGLIGDGRTPAAAR